VNQMSSALASPLVRYGIGAASAAALLFLAFTAAEGPTRWFLVLLAAAEFLVTPRILEYAAEG